MLLATVGSVTRLMPTSMTVAPGLTNDRRTKPGRPIAETRISAACGNSRQGQASANGKPSRSHAGEGEASTPASRRCRFGRCTTACLPATSIPLRCSSSMMPAGVQGIELRAILNESPDVGRCHAVDVLRRIDGVEDLLHRRRAQRIRQAGPERECRRSSASRIQRSDERQDFIERRRSRQMRQRGRIPSSPADFSLLLT